MLNLPHYGLSQISIPKVDQTPVYEEEDGESQTVFRQSWTTEGQGPVHIFADRNVLDQDSLIESFKSCIIDGSMSQSAGSDADEDPMEEEKLDN